MKPNVQFFYDNAGWSYDPKTETSEQGRMNCAEKLAKAEKYAHKAGYCFHWEVDQLVDSSDWNDDPEPWEQWQCVMYDNSGHVAASLGGIDFGRDGSPFSDDYRRVVEAELALEVMP